MGARVVWDHEVFGSTPRYPTYQTRLLTKRETHGRRELVAQLPLIQEAR